jgi:hypothetical protein
MQMSYRAKAIDIWINIQYLMTPIGRSNRFTGMDRPLVNQTPTISRQLAHESSHVISPTHPPPLHPTTYPWYLLLLEIERPQAIRESHGKIPNDPVGNRTHDLPVCSACVNQLRHRVLQQY